METNWIHEDRDGDEMNRLIFGLLGFAMVALIACGGGDEPAAELLPDGFERHLHETGLFSLAFPNDWTEIEESKERTRIVISIGLDQKRALRFAPGQCVIAFESSEIFFAEVFEQNK